MKIGIIGGGSIGLLFAYFLQKKHEVTVYTRTEEQKTNLLLNGLLLSEGDQVYQSGLRVKTIKEWTCEDGLTIITVKQYQLHEVIQIISNQSKSAFSSFLFLQNGMGHVKWLEELEAENIYVGSVEHGAYRVSGNHVAFTGHGVTKVAVYRGDDVLIREIIRQEIDRFPFVYEDSYYEMLVSKLIVNAVINPLTALLKVKNGELINNPHFNLVFCQLFDEVVDVLKIENRAVYFDLLVNICRNTAENRSSMLKDMEENRQTEIDAILGYLIEKSLNDRKKPSLITALYHFVKGSE